MKLNDFAMPAIGQKCIGINFTRDTAYNGMDCEVKSYIEITEHTKGRDGAIWEPGLYFGCRWSNGTEGGVALHNLKPVVNP